MAEQQQDDRTMLVLLNQKVDFLTQEIHEIRAKLEKDYVTQDQLQILKNDFTPIKRIVYGIVSMILISVFGAMIALVIIKR